jgi:BirA family biotin operon repressor/biotin-[acetyl-CoA-carboxylase] ligase
MAGDLTAERVAERLTTERYGRSLELRDETGSTNDDARSAALAGAPDGHLVVAESQRQGRGSRGRRWISPGGQDLYFSLLVRLPLSIERLPPLTLAVGLAVAESAEAFLPPGLGVQVKWPNDVWIARRKLAGILVESASSSCSRAPTQEALQPVVIGVGINVRRRDFPDDLDTPPTSLALAAGERAAEPAREPDLDRAPILARVLSGLEHWVERYVHEGLDPVAQALAPRLALRGELARCDECVGTVLGISREGALLLQTDQGVRGMLAGTLRPA